MCSGRTGHAEAVKVVFDETVIPPSVILDVFFTLHDPRQLNRQGNDVGTQYRSAMFYTDDDQKKQFEEARDRASEYWDGGIVTEIVAARRMDRRGGVPPGLLRQEPRSGLLHGSSPTQGQQGPQVVRGLRAGVLALCLVTTLTAGSKVIEIELMQ